MFILRQSPYQHHQQSEQSTPFSSIWWFSLLVSQTMLLLDSWFYYCYTASCVMDSNQKSFHDYYVRTCLSSLHFYLRFCLLLLKLLHSAPFSFATASAPSFFPNKLLRYIHHYAHLKTGKSIKFIYLPVHRNAPHIQFHVWDFLRLTAYACPSQPGRHCRLMCRQCMYLFTLHFLKGSTLFVSSSFFFLFFRT